MIANSIKLTVGELVDEFKNNKIKHDESFQRYACWDLENIQEYIQCLVKGHHPGTFLFGDTNQPPKNKMDGYFPNLKRLGFEKVSVDGNNRSTTLCQFMNNEFPICDPHSQEQKFFKDYISDGAGEAFRNIEVHAVVYTDVTRDELADIFLAHNTSTEVSKQEKRNARKSAISAMMRAYQPEGVPFFKLNNEKRQNDQWILQMITILEDTTKVPNEKRLEHVWNLPSDTLVPLFDITKEIFGMLIDFFKTSSHKPGHTLGVTADVFAAISMLTANGEQYSKSNLKELVYKVASQHIKLYNDNVRITFDGDDTNFVKQFKGITLSAKAYLERKRIINEMILSKVLSCNDIKPYTKRERDTTDPELRFKLCKNQNYICPETGKTITNPQDGRLWHVDHIIALANGGPDEESNMRLICAEANRRKGAR